MVYMVTFTINISPMLAYIPYMDPMGYGILFHAIGLTILPLPCAAEKQQRSIFQHAPLAPQHWGLSLMRTVDVPLQVLCGDETAATSA